MRNPWVHDDVPDDAGGGYDGGVGLLAAFMWGSLLLLVGGFVLLSVTGVVDVTAAGSVGSVVTGVVAALALALALPLVLRLLSFSRALAALAFLATTGLVGRFVVAREPEQFAPLFEARDRLTWNAGSVGELLDAVDAASAATVDASLFAPAAVDAAAALAVAVPGV